MSEDRIPVQLRMTGGRIDIDSAPALHAWMKEVNAYEEDEEWDESPVAALLLTDPTGEAAAMAFIAVMVPMAEIKPYMLIKSVGLVMLKTARTHGAGEPIALSLYTEAWGYSAPADLMDEDENLPENWRSVATRTEEQKVITTVAIPPSTPQLFSYRTRGSQTWEDPEEDRKGLVAEAMADAAEFLASQPLDPETPNQEES